MELTQEDRAIIIQALESISIPVNQAQRVLEIIAKLKVQQMTPPEPNP